MKFNTANMQYAAEPRLLTMECTLILGIWGKLHKNGVTVPIMAEFY